MLVVMQPIKVGEEITFDYGMADATLSGKEKCLCGSKSCRGVILGYFQLPKKIQRKYTGFISDYLIGLK